MRFVDFPILDSFPQKDALAPPTTPTTPTSVGPTRHTPTTPTIYNNSDNSNNSDYSTTTYTDYSDNCHTISSPRIMIRLLSTGAEIGSGLGLNMKYT